MKDEQYMHMLQRIVLTIIMKKSFALNVLEVNILRMTSCSMKSLSETLVPNELQASVYLNNYCDYAFIHLDYCVLLFEQEGQKGKGRRS